MNSFEQFMEYSSSPLYQKYGQVYAVKVVYDAKTNEIYFVSSEEYQYHHEFCEEELLYYKNCLLYTSPSPRDATLSRMPSSA